MGVAPKDLDIEVFGISYTDLAKILKTHGKANLVGRSFGVIKLTLPSGNTYDFTIPRRDSKTAPGHKGFEIAFDPNLTLKEAAARRDFTINALMFHIVTGELFDFFGGREDIEHKVLRHTTEAFIEDPLRVLRGMQFAARFDLMAAPETIALSARIAPSYSELSIERVREEWFKWAAKSLKPSAGLHFLAQTGWIQHFPEIQALQSTPQDPQWHPEGSVWNHTVHVCDAMLELPEWRQADETTRIVLLLAALTHDLGKPQTTQQAIKEGQMRIVSPGMKHRVE